MDYVACEAEVLARLKPLGEPERVLQAQNDKKSQLQFLAIKVPVLRRVGREGFSFYQRSAEEILAIWNYIWFHSPYYEVLSMALGYYERFGAKIAPETWPVLSGWSKRVENWAHCDSLANIYSYLLAQRHDEVYDQLRQWNASTEIWLRRLSLVSLIHYSGKKAVFLPLDEVLPMLTNCLDDQRLYVQKALGWVLRETGYVYHDEVRAYLEKYITIMSSIAFSTAADCFQPADRQELMALRKLRRNEEKRRGRASFDATDASL
ncbi:MAG TPA: DNA alkylation repair protein [Ktedonobacteraceae bacterium]|nr:DNA alkylation repair protein [Ktedonobacteraceae bacterium]